MKFIRSSVCLVFIYLFSGCNQSGREGDVLFIGYRYVKDSNAYASVNATKYIGDGYAMSLNASPHVKI